MRFLIRAAVIVCLTAGCAGNGTAIPQEREIGRDREEVLRQRLDTTGVSITLPRDAERVRALLPAVYEAFGLAPVEVEEGTARVGVRNRQTRGRLAGAPLSAFVDCGTSRPGLPNADRYDVRLTVLTNSAPLGARNARVWTIVTAEAYDPLAGSSQKVLCYTTGGLEAKLHAEIDRRLAIP